MLYALRPNAGLSQCPHGIPVGPDILVLSLICEEAGLSTARSSYGIYVGLPTYITAVYYACAGRLVCFFALIWHICGPTRFYEC